MSRLTKQQLLLIAIFTALNLLLSGSILGNGHDLAGHAVASRSPEMRRAALLTYLVSMPLLSFVVGAAIAAVPFRDKPYSEKLLLYGLWILAGMNFFFLIAGTLKFILQWQA
jgi:hypothetical protein